MRNFLDAVVPLLMLLGNKDHGTGRFSSQIKMLKPHGLLNHLKISSVFEGKDVW
jgi:hypothetical protein